jgi:hypothetical protein
MTTPKNANKVEIGILRKYPIATTEAPAKIPCPEGNELSGR